jgi:hypothetical protein
MNVLVRPATSVLMLQVSHSRAVEILSPAYKN